MNFFDLYKFSEEIISKRIADDSESVVLIDELKDNLKQSIDWIEHINIHPIDCKPGDPFGHYECHGTQESKYDTPNSWVVLITYDQAQNMCGCRYIWCKELMHIFDTEDGLVNEHEKYTGFLGEIELGPIDLSKKYISENTAKWMALLILCPKKHRDSLVSDVNNGLLSHYDVALKFRIPESIVPSLFSKYYDTAHQFLI